MAKKSNTDPTQDRLAQVEQSDLGESQLNEEFVDWLKKWGNQILLAILVVALLGVGWQWLVRTKMESRDAAWATLESAQLPASLEEVAASSEGVDSITPLALMRAGDQYLRSVQTGTASIGSRPPRTTNSMRTRAPSSSSVPTPSTRRRSWPWATTGNERSPRSCW